jgi:hypothetical protein
VKDCEYHKLGFAPVQSNHKPTLEYHKIKKKSQTNLSDAEIKKTNQKYQTTTIPSHATEST